MQEQAHTQAVIEETTIDQGEFTAIFCPETNRLTVSAKRPFVSEEYRAFKGAGFHWFHQKNVFVSGQWTPYKEDFARKYAGEIESGEPSQKENKGSNDQRRRSRINDLFVELQEHQSMINHGHLNLKLIMDVVGTDDPTDRKNKIKALFRRKFRILAPFDDDAKREYENGEINETELLKLSIDRAHSYMFGAYHKRWVVHTMKRLAYERQQLSKVPRFEGELTPTIIKGFLRTVGAYKPNVKKGKGDKWLLSSEVPFPLLIGGIETHVCDSGLIHAFMACVGYDVPPEKPKAPPLLNFRSAGDLEMTRAEYRDKHKDFKCVSTSPCGRYRYRQALALVNGGSVLCPVFLTDSKEHPAPEPIKKDQEG